MDSLYKRNNMTPFQEGDRVEEAVKEILSIVRDSKSFTLKHAPDIAKQIIEWNRRCCQFWIITWVVISFALVLPTWYGMGAVDVWHDSRGAWCWFGVVGWPIAVLVILFNVLKLVKISTAPKLYIIEHLMGLLPSE